MTKQFLNILWLKNTFYALTQFLIEYGIVAWRGPAETLITSIQIVQSTILKIMYNKPRLTPNIQLYNETLALTVKQLYLKKNIVLYKKKFTKKKCIKTN